MAGRVYGHDWRKVRAAVLERDGGVCQIRGPECQGTADQVDHVVPVGYGGARLDPANLRAACRTCNGGRGSRLKAKAGWRTSRTRITLVVGPPGSGKTSWVEEQSEPGDVVIDYDRLAEALGSPVSHDHGGQMHQAVSAARGALLRKVRRGEVDADRVFIVSSNPEAERRFPYHDLKVLDPGEGEAIRRCREAGRPEKWMELVRQWYAAREGGYQPSREW